MNRTKINTLTALDKSPGQVRVMGWVRTKRDAKGFSFLEINDGSCLGNIQVVADGDLTNYQDVLKLGHRVCCGRGGGCCGLSGQGAEVGDKGP